MESWRVKLTAGGKNLAEVKIQRGVFQRNVLSPLLFVIEIMPLNHIFKKYAGRYKLHRLKAKVSTNKCTWTISNCLLKMKKKTGTLKTGSENIQRRYRNGIWHRKMCFANNKK